VTAVGGTQFKFQDDNSQGTIIGEEVWNNSPTSQQAGGGSTGSRLPRPDYQKNLSISGGRIVPDISFIASPSAYGQIPVCTQTQKCVMRVVGGTSASAPSVAGALADTIEALSSAEGLPRRLGLLNPTLYALAQQKSESKLFQDITKGNNDLYGTGCCAAKKKYDAASGLGSLKLDKVFSLFGR
jgi:subtilase family serine protease